MANLGRLDLTVGVNTDRASFNQLNKALQQVQDKMSKSPDKIEPELKKAAKAAEQLQKILGTSWNEKLNQFNLTKVNSEIQKTYGSVQKLSDILAGAGKEGQAAFNSFASQVLNTNLQIKESNQLLNDFADNFGKVVKYGLASSIFNTIKGTLQQAFYYAKDLDLSLTDIRIVTGDSADHMERFAKSANQAAQKLGRSTLDYTKAALSFYQQGLSDDEVQTRAQNTLMAQNITGAGTEMADYLTAVWNGFKVSGAEETTEYVDKLAAVADSSASNMSQLAIAMSKVASTANDMGVDINQLSAQIATIIATTRQAPETVGTALKTVYARINDIKTGAEGAEVSLGKYSEQMASLGFNVLDSSGKLRDTGQVIEQVGNSWASLTRQQQINLAQVLGGTRQYSLMISLFSNWEKYSEMLNVSLGAQGTLQEKNSIYLESVKAHMEQLNVETERTYQILSDTKALNAVTDLARMALDSFNDLIEGLGGGRTVLANFAAQFVNLFNNQIGKAINQQIQNIQSLINNMDAVKMKQDVINTVRLNAASQGRELTDTALEKQAEVAERILKVRKSLTQEEYNEFTAMQKRIGTAQRELDMLQQKKDTLAMTLDLSEDEIEGNANGLQNIIKENEESQKRLNFIKEYQKSLKSGSATLETQKQLQQEISALVKSTYITQQDRATLNRLLSQEGKKQINSKQSLRTLLEIELRELKAQKDVITDRVQLEKILLEIKQKENALTASQNVSDEMLKQKQRQQAIANAVRLTSSAVQGLTTVVGGLNTAFKENSSSAQRLNGLFATMSGGASALANAFSPGSGFLVQGLFNLGKGVLELIGAWERLEYYFSTAEQKLQKFNTTNQKFLNQTKQYRQARTEVSSLRDQFEILSKKTGHFSEEQQDRYNQIAEIFKKYNQNVIAGYDSQGNAIIRKSQAIDRVLDKLDREYDKIKRNTIAQQDYSVLDTPYQQAVGRFKNLVGAYSLEDIQNSSSGVLDQLRQNAVQLLNNGHDIVAPRMKDEIDAFEEQLNSAQTYDQIQKAFSEFKDKINEEVNKLSKNVAGASKDADVTDTIFDLLDNLQSKIPTFEEMSDEAGAAYSDIVDNASIQVEQLVDLVSQTDTYDDIKDNFSSQEWSDYAQEIINSLIASFAEGLSRPIDTETILSGKKLPGIEDFVPQVEQYLKNGNIEEISINLIKELDGIYQKIDKDIENAYKEGNTAQKTQKILTNSIRNILDFKEVQTALKNDDENKNFHNYIKNILKENYNIEDFDFIQEDGKIIATNAQTHLMSAMEDILSKTPKLSGKTENWLWETLTGDQLLTVQNAVKNKEGLFGTLSQFKDFVNNLFEEDINPQPVLEKFEKVTAAISKLKNEKDLNYKEKTQLADILGLSLKDLEELDTREKMLKKIMEQVKTDASGQQRYEAIILYIDNLKQLEEAVQSGLITQQQAAQYRSSIFQKELENLGLTSQALQEYAEIKEAALGKEVSDEQALGLYQQAQALSKMEDVLSSNIEKIQQYGQGKATLQQVWLAFASIQEAYKDLFPEEEELKLTDLIANLDNLKFIIDENVFSLENLKSIFSGEFQADFVEKFFGTPEKIAETKSSFDSITQSALKLEEISKEDTQTLIDMMDALVAVYPQVADAANIVADTWLAGTDAYKEALEEVKQALNGVEIRKSAQKLEAIFDDLSKFDITIGIDDSEFQIWKNDVEDFFSADRQISINLDNAINDEFEYLKNSMDEIYEAAGKIGQNFIVAGEDIAQVLTVFPEIAQGMQLLDDGSYQLSQNMVQYALATAQKDVDANSQSVSQKLRQEADFYDEKAAIYKSIAQAAYILATNEELSAQESAKYRGQISQGINDLQAKNKSQLVQVLAAGDQDIAANYGKSMQNVQQDSNDTIVKVSGGWRDLCVNMMENLSQVKNAIVRALRGQDFEWNPSAITQAFQTGVSNLFNQLGGRQNNVNTGPQFDNLEGLTSQGYMDIYDAASRGAMLYQQLADQARANAAQIEANRRRLDTGLGNVERGQGINGAKPQKTNDSKPSSSRTPSSSGRTPSTTQEKPQEIKEGERLDLLKSEVDIYHDINVQLQKIARQLSKVQKEQEKLTGKNLLDNYQKQLDLLNKQIGAQKAKIELAKIQAGQLRAQLTKFGASFDNTTGEVLGYADLMKAHQDAVNSFLSYYNTLTKEQQEQAKITLDIVQQDYQDFKKYMEHYEELIHDTIPDLADAVQQELDEKIAIKIKAFKISVEAKINLNQLTQDYNNFIKNVVKQIRSEDILGNAEYDFLNVQSYLATESKWNSLIGQTHQIEDIIEQINSINTTGTSSIYGDDKASALQDLAKYRQSLQGDLENLQNLANNIKNSIIESIQQIEQGYEKRQSYYEYINNLLAHDEKMVELIFGQKAYDKMNFLYTQQEKHDKEHLRQLNEEKTYWRERLDQEIAYQQTLQEQSNEWWDAQDRIKEFEQNWMEATKKLNSSLESAIENLIKKHENAINRIFSDLEKKLTGGKSLNYISQQWELINENAELYLDDINAMYETQKLRGRYDTALKDTKNNIKAQKELKALLENQVSALREKQKISQYDIDRANKILDIELKRLALQETANSKSSLKLRRDTQGNYSYQFANDEEETDTRLQELRDAENELYNLTKAAYNENLDNIISAYKDWQDALYDVEEARKQGTISEEEAKQMQALINEKYIERINTLTKQGDAIRVDLAKETFSSLINLSKDAAEADARYVQQGINVSKNGFRGLTEEALQALLGIDGSYNSVFGKDGSISTYYKADYKNVQDWMADNKELIDKVLGELAKGPYADNAEAFKNMIYNNENGMVPTWHNGVTELAEAFKGQGGFQAVVAQVMEKLDKENQSYKASLKQVEEAAGVDFSSIGSSINADITKTEELKRANDKLVISYQGVYDAIRKLNQKLQTLIDKYKDVIQAAQDAVSASYKLEQEEARRAAEQTDPREHPIQDNPVTVRTSLPSSNSSSSTSSGDKLTQYDSWVMQQPFRGYQSFTYTNGLLTSANGAGARPPERIWDLYKALGWVNSSGSAYLPSNAFVSGAHFDTGGYTGDWSSKEGKVGILHEKELILNKDDTKNLLATINLMKGINDHILGNFSLSSLFNKAANGNNSELQQNVHIEANFPSVSNSNEIEKAFESLMNKATQYIYRNNKF